MKPKILLLFFLSISSYTFAQINYPAPTGVYCSCPPTSVAGSISVIPNVASLPFVKGVLVRVGWSDLEPSDNIFNWYLIDQQITAANSYVKKISLAIGCGPQTPQWIFSIGVQYVTEPTTHPPYIDSIALPWDSIFISKWTSLIDSLGRRYKNDTTITLVYMTNSTQNGNEMQLPPTPTPSWVSVGYADLKVINSWKTIIDAFSASFPNHYLTNDFHPVNNSNAVADSVFAFANNLIPARYGASAWWWSQNNTTVYPAQDSILSGSAINNPFTGIQMVKSGTIDSATFGAGGMPAALQLAIDNKICYWEIWNEDIVNSNFTTLLSNASCNTTGIDVPLIQNNQVTVYPNPFSLQTTIEADEVFKNATLTVCNLFGQNVKQMKNISGQTIILFRDNLPDGLYFFKLTEGEKIFKTDKLVITNN